MMSRRRMKDKKTKLAVKNKKTEVEISEKVTPSKEDMFASEKKNELKKEGIKFPSKRA